MSKESNSQSLLISLNIFATITAIVFAVLSQTDDDFDFISKWHIILGVFVLYLIINFRRVIIFIDKVKSKIKFLLNIVIEYRRGHLEFIDKYGNKAMYNEECLFKRIRRNETYSSSIESDGLIDNEIHTFNCYNSLNHSRNKVTITYGKRRKNKDLIHNKRQLQFAFVITLCNSYMGEREFWGTKFEHYTKVYDLKMSFSKKNPPRNVGLFNVKKDEKGDLILTPLPIDPIVIQKYNRIILKIKVLHANKGDLFRVYWDWDKPKSDSKKNNKVKEAS